MYMCCCCCCILYMLPFHFLPSLWPTRFLDGRLCSYGFANLPSFVRPKYTTFSFVVCPEKRSLSFFLFLRLACLLATRRTVYHFALLPTTTTMEYTDASRQLMHCLSEEEEEQWQFYPSMADIEWNCTKHCIAFIERQLYRWSRLLRITPSNPFSSVRRYIHIFEQLFIQQVDWRDWEKLV